MAQLINEEENDEGFYTDKFGEAIFAESGSEFASEEEGAFMHTPYTFVRKLNHSSLAESWDELDSDFDAAEAMEEERIDEAVYEPEEARKQLSCLLAIFSKLCCIRIPSFFLLPCFFLFSVL